MPDPEHEDDPQTEAPPFGRYFEALNGESGDAAFTIHVCSPLTDATDPDYGRYADFEMHSADATLQVHLPGMLTKGELLRLAQWIRAVALELKDDE